MTIIQQKSLPQMLYLILQSRQFSKMDAHNGNALPKWEMTFGQLPIAVEENGRKVSLLLYDEKHRIDLS